MPRGGPDHPEPSPARPRAAAALGAFALGLLLAYRAVDAPSIAWFALAAGAAALALVARGRACAAALLVAAVALGGAWMTFRVREVPASSLARLVPPDSPSLVRVEGVLERDAQRTESPSGPLIVPMNSGDVVRLDVRLALAQTDAGWQPVSGRVIARVPGLDAAAWTSGTPVRLTGRLLPPQPPGNPGEPDFAALARQRHVAGTLFVPTPELVEHAALPSWTERARSALLRARGNVRRRAARALAIDPDSLGESLVGALVLGQRGPELDDVQTSFRRAGVAHLMAISGFHLAVLAALALFLSRLTGERGWLEPALVAALILLYVLVLPARPPIIRAAVMVIALLAADASGRRYDRLAVLAWVTVALLVWRPLDVLQLGFQLTVGITALLIVLNERRRRWTVERALGRRAPGWARRVLAPLATCLACWVVAAPAIAYHTGVVSPIAPIAALLALVPVLLTMELGYLAVALGLLFGGAGWATTLAGVVGGWTVALVTWLDALPGSSFRVAPVSAIWAIGATALGAWFVARPRWRDWRPWTGALVLAVWFAGEQLSGARLPRDVLLRVDTLDVADGTCHLVRSADDAILWDCGSLRPGLGEQTIPDALRALGRVRVRTALISHPNLDHFNALPDVAERVGLERVLVTPRFLETAERPGSGEAVALERLHALGVRVQTIAAGDAFDLGRAHVEVLWPPAPTDDAPTRRGVLGDNDTAVVARLSVETPAGPRRVLFTGDVQERAIAGLADADAPVRADVLEVPHHGSVRAEAVALAFRVDPSVVLQSTGPSRVALPAWDGVRAGRTWLCTATDGAIWAELRADGSVVSGSMRGN